MNWEAIKTGLAQIALTALFAGTTGWLWGTSQTAQLVTRIDRLNDKLDRWEITAKGRREFMNDAGARVELLCNENHDCRARFQPMHVPE